MRTIEFSLRIIYSAFLLLSVSCHAQTSEGNACNRRGSDKSIEKAIPKGICAPDSYTVDKTVTGFDFNYDMKEDFALRYASYPLIDGNMRHYSIYEMVNDTTFIHRKKLNSLSIPYISVLTKSYLDSHPVADSLHELYPTNVELSFDGDTILVSHSVPEYYGKTYVFLYDSIKLDWYLKKVRYWIGELPTWLIKNGNLREELYGKVYLDEDKIPKKGIQIDSLNLIESKKIAGEEGEYLMNKYDVFDWSE